MKYLATTVGAIVLLAASFLLPAGGAAGEDRSPASTKVSFAKAITRSTPQLFPLGLAAGDLNGDGFPDLAIASCSDFSLPYALGNGDGTFGQWQGGPTYKQPCYVLLADVNQDGKVDAITSTTVYVVVGFGDGRGRFTSSVSCPTGTATGPGPLTVGKIDGHTVIVGVDYLASQIFILSAKPTGCSKPRVLGSGGSSPSDIAVGDLNHDGIDDIVVANHGAYYGKGNIAVRLGKGHGRFDRPVTYRAGLNPVSVVLGDFNHDGNLDAAVAGVGTDVDILLGKGDGTFWPSKRYPAAGGGGSIVTADLNGDGNLDMVVLTSVGSSGGVSVLLGNGDGSFQPPVKFKTGAGVGQVIVADFNHDGKPDLATINNADSSFSILLNTTKFPQDAP
jgi:hypothetical protein